MAGLGESAGEDERGLAVFGREVNIAAGHGESVALSDGGHRDDFDFQLLIFHHAADDTELLRILLTEVRAAGADDAKETGDNGCDAAEVARTVLSFEAVGERTADFDPIIEAGGVDFVGCRDEGNYRMPFRELAKQLDIAGGTSGVLIQVFAGAELGWVHENRDDDVVVLGKRAADEGKMAFV
jgi:hypothetical protein